MTTVFVTVVVDLPSVVDVVVVSFQVSSGKIPLLVFLQLSSNKVLPPLFLLKNDSMVISLKFLAFLVFFTVFLRVCCLLVDSLLLDLLELLALSMLIMLCLWFLLIRT